MLKKDKKVYLSVILALSSILAVVFVTNLFNNYYPESALVSEDPIQSSGFTWKGEFCVTIKDKDGNLKEESCDHNVLTYQGMNATRDLIRNGGGSTAYFRNISFANCSAACGVPAITPTASYTAFAGCGLLSSASSATTAINPSTNGNFSVTVTYTSTCNNVVSNLTRLLNESGTIVAEASVNSFNLSIDDTVTGNWTVSIV